MFQVSKTFSFDAAHALRGYAGSCERLHGHRFEVAVCVEGERLSDLGILVDFRDLKAAMARATADYDHNNLNDVPPFTEINPSAELLAQVIFQTLRAELAQQTPVARLAYVQVWESPTSWAKYWE